MRFLRRPRDPLRGSACSRCKNTLFVRFLRCPRDPLRGSAWSRCKNSRFFLQFTRATLCGDRRGRGAKTQGFLRFLRCPRGTLRGSAWSRCKNSRCFCDLPARPSAGIGVVEVQKLEVFCDSCGACATLCGDRRGRGAKTADLLRFCGARMNPLRRSCVSSGAVRIRFSLGEPSAEIVRVEALSLWRRAILSLAKWPLEVVSWFARLLSQSRSRGLDSPLLRGMQLRLKQRSRSMWSVLLAAPTGKSQP